MKGNIIEKVKAIIRFQHVFLGFLMVSLTNCSSNNSEAEFPSENAQLDQVPAVNLPCAPNDSSIKVEGGVAFLMYVQDGEMYNLWVGIGDDTLRLDYQFPCDAAFRNVPTFDWANDSIVSLKRRGSGYNGWKNLFFFPKTGWSTERENILAALPEQGIVAYLKFDSDGCLLVVEHLISEEKQSHILQYVPPCSELESCIDSVRLNSNSVTVIWKDIANQKKNLKEEFSVNL